MHHNTIGGERLERTPHRVEGSAAALYLPDVSGIVGQASEIIIRVAETIVDGPGSGRDLIDLDLINAHTPAIVVCHLEGNLIAAGKARQRNLHLLRLHLSLQATRTRMHILAEH